MSSIGPSSSTPSITDISHPIGCRPAVSPVCHHGDSLLQVRAWPPAEVELPQVTQTPPLRYWLAEQVMPTPPIAVQFGGARLAGHEGLVLQHDCSWVLSDANPAALWQVEKLRERGCGRRRGTGVVVTALPCKYVCNKTILLIGQ
jgi:hypothetical protein